MLKIKINPIKSSLNESTNNILCSVNSTSNGFILPTGEHIRGNNQYHEELAFELVQKYPELQTILTKISNGSYLADELVFQKGFVKVSNAYNYLINPEKVTIEQAKKIMEIMWSCPNISKSLLNIYDINSNRQFVQMPAIDANERKIMKGSIVTLYESITKKFKKFLKENLELKTIDLYHGCCLDSAKYFIQNGWTPRSGRVGGNQGQNRYLYCSTHYEDALWFAQEKGCNSVVKISNVLLSDLQVDPEDGTHDTVEQEVTSRNGFPGKVVLFKETPKEKFSIITK